MTDHELDLAAQAIEQRYDELPRREARAELIAIAAERDARASRAKVDALLKEMSGLTEEQRAALAAQFGASFAAQWAPKTQTIGVGTIESGARVPGLGG